MKEIDKSKVKLKKGRGRPVSPEIAEMFEKFQKDKFGIAFEVSESMRDAVFVHYRRNKELLPGKVLKSQEIKTSAKTKKYAVWTEITT